jgi:superfamily II DNA or RNA helicase
MTPPAATLHPSFRPGTIIRARQRLWRVDRLEAEELFATTIDGGETEQHRLYLGFDPTGKPFEPMEPARLDPPDARKVGYPAAQDLLLRAYRLSLLHGSAPLLSLQRSRVIPTNYQLVPVALALEEPRVRLAIFDDVGLGKTIEAGQIVTELLARQMAARVLIVCPANLREQWREALAYFFHLEARIISTRHRREMERQLPIGANPWEFYRCLIVSEDYAKEPAQRQQILEQPWDIVVIDEVHTLAKPHQSRAEDKPDMERWHLASQITLSPKVRHLLLLTATPHNGYSDSFASLLRMLDVGAVEGPEHAPIIHRQIAQKHVCQRTRRDLRAWFEREGRPDAFPEREQVERIITLTAAEQSALDAVADYGRMVLEDAEGTPRQVIAGWAIMHLRKRALSSPEALRKSLRNRRDGLRRRLRAMSADEADVSLLDEGEAVPVAAARAYALDSDPGERLPEEEAGQRLERGLYAGKTPGRQAIEQELQRLEELIKLAEKITPAQDSKLKMALLNDLPELLRRHPRVIIFTRYRDTMEYVADQIERSERYKDVKVVRIEGSLSEQQRREVFVEFAQAKKAVLVATDAISEGINLQHACCQMIHWELPWNPNRLEQRVGRIDRFGQPEPKVVVRLMVMEDSLDGLVLETLVKKAAQIRAEFGFAPPYFGDDEAILYLLREQGRKLHLWPQQLSLFDQELKASSAPEQDPFAIETLERIKTESFYGATDITVPDIEQRLRKTEAALGSPAQVRDFVRSGLQAFGCRLSDNPDQTFQVVITTDTLRVEGVPDVIERATFDPQAALDDPLKLTLLDLGHPLVQRLIDVVKTSAFRESGERYGRTSSLITKAARETTALLHLLARYVVGTTPLSIVEELIPVAFPIYSAGGMLTQEQTEALLHAQPEPRRKPDDEVSEDLAVALQRPDLAELLHQAVEARRLVLVAERQAMLARAGASPVPPASVPGRPGAGRWLAGIDQLEIASYDVLTASICYPDVG